MNKQEVKTLMESSKSEKEWNANTDIVKRNCKGYPDFWYETIIQSGLLDDVRARW